ncbi:hypothetical protein N7E81_07610 [Reichenbachiella carrageenanivorans]|uniref:DUF5689 domain-containing protein n=1 Tax=Reichenbachiella carrageenanivorans TaxID=2979869 RepID=A0ABY6D4D4_9BACT|nr:hypothetical protein [Reichenbachiella carrageenanivorans]UXX80963.1 hypothetical protein N7E81_07610 [Reichenbachiella carrageenanivorans]
MKDIKNIILASVIGVIVMLSSCEKTDVETPGVAVEAYTWVGYLDTVSNPGAYQNNSDYLIRTIPGINQERESILTNKDPFMVGDEIIFVVDHSASLLAIYTGDTLHRYSGSALALVDRSRIETEIFAVKIDSVNRFKADFNLLAINDQEIPSALTISAGNPTLDYDEKYKINGMKLVTSSLANDDTLRFNIEGAGVKLGANKSLFIDYRPLPFANDRDSVIIEVKVSFENIESAVATQITQNRQQVYGAVEFDLAPYLTDWIATNGYPSTGNPEITNVEIKMFKPNATAPWNDMFVRGIQISENEYLPFDTGVSIAVVREGEGDFIYTYSEAGTYTVTVLGTNNGYRDYSGDPLQSSADEFEINRAMAEIDITINEPTP